MLRYLKLLIGKEIVLRDHETGLLNGTITFAGESTGTEHELFGPSKYKLLVEVKEASSRKEDEKNTYTVLISNDSDAGMFNIGKRINVIYYWYINTEQGVKTANSEGFLYRKM